MQDERLCLFAPGHRNDLGRAVARRLGIEVTPLEERNFEDGEHKSRPLANVRGRDVFVVRSLHADADESVNDKLCRLLFLMGALVDASAARVTAVVPYLAYARKDRQTKSRDPVTTRYVAALFEAVGVARVVTIDVHNLAAFQNAFRCRTDHLEAKGLFVHYFAVAARAKDVVVVSPDVGGVKRAEAFREALSESTSKPIAMAFMEKQRSAGVVSGEAFVGDVKGKTAIIIDDMISSGTTILRAARACRERGARAVYAAASHGLFVGEANRVLADVALDGTVVTDTIPPFRLTDARARARVTVIETAPLLAEAIVRIHRGGSVVELLDTHV